MSQLRLLRPRCHPAPRFPGAANSPGCVHHLCASGRGVFRSSLPGPAVQRLYYVLAILYELLLYYDPPVLAVSTKERLSCRGRDQLVLLVSPPPASAAACCPLCLLCRLSLPLAFLAFSFPAFLSRAPRSLLCSSSPALPSLSFLLSFPSASSPCFLSSLSCSPSPRRPFVFGLAAFVGGLRPCFGSARSPVVGGRVGSVFGWPAASCLCCCSLLLKLVPSTSVRRRCAWHPSICMDVFFQPC